MKSYNWMLILILLVLIFVGCKEEPKTTLCGTWRMTVGTYVGPGFSTTSDEKNRISYKILSQKHFAVIEMFHDNPDSQFFAAVGTYAFDDTSYTENYEASNIASKIGQSLRFKSKVKDGKWDIQLKTKDMELNETWMCVNKPSQMQR